MEAGSEIVEREGSSVSTLTHTAHEQFDSPTFFFLAVLFVLKGFIFRMYA